MRDFEKQWVKLLFFSNFCDNVGTVEGFLKNCYNRGVYGGKPCLLGGSALQKHPAAGGIIQEKGREVTRMKMKKLAAGLLCAAAVLSCQAAFLTGCGRPLAEDTFFSDVSLPPAESRLTVATSHKKEVWWPVVREFEERTGIWVDVIEGGTNELLQKIEESGDVPAADVMFGGGVESLEAHAGLFLPYRPLGDDDIDPRYRSGDGAWTPFSALPVVLVYNTKLVEKNRLMSWEDLLKDEFRGRIAFADPERSGSSFTALVTMDLASGDPEFAGRFADQLDGKLLENSGDVVTAVSDGSALAGITLEETALRKIAEGANIALAYPAEGTSAVPDGTAVVRGTKREEAAKRFVDFTVDPDVQALLPERLCRRPVLENTDAGVLTAAGLPAPETLKLIDYDVQDAAARHDEILFNWSFWPGGEEAGR